jgi:hypothetical protein
VESGCVKSGCNRSSSELAGAGEDSFEHGDGELSGGGVLVGGMVGGEQSDAVGQGVLCGVGEDVARFGRKARWGRWPVAAARR